MLFNDNVTPLLSRCGVSGNSLYALGYLRLALHGGWMAKSQIVNGFLFGVLTQQFYSYWISGVFVAGQRYQGRLPGSRFQGPGTCQVS